MADRKARNEKERRDRLELAEYRRITAEALGNASPTPKDLAEAMSWRNRVVDFLNTIALRRHPYFNKQEMPK